MRLRVVFLCIGIGLIYCILAHNVTNHTILCDEDRWSAQSGSSIENGVLTAGEGTEGRVLETLYYSLDQGDYRVAVKFHSSAPGAMLVVETSESPFMTVELPAGEAVDTVEVPVSLEKDCVDFRLYISKPAECSLVVWEIDITGDKPVSQDYTYLAVVAALLLAGLYYLIFINNGRIPPETVLDGMLLLAVCFLISAPMFRNGFYSADDVKYHAYKIEGIRDAIKSGQFPVYFFPHTFNGYGYLNALYPSLFIYPAAFLRMLGVSAAACYKSLMFAVNLGTAWIAYRCSKRLIGQHRQAPVLFAFLYLTAPYRITNLWVRGAAGELIAMMFLPLIAVGLYELLAGDRKKWWYLAVGYSGLIQSHVLSCLMVLIFSVLTGLFYVDVFFKEKRWIELLKVIGCLLAFNAWFLIPFVVYMGLDLNLSKLHKDWFIHVMDVAELFQSYVSGLPGTYRWRSNTIGPAGMICMTAGIVGVLVNRNKNQKQRFLSVLLAAGVIFTVLMTNLVPWKQLRELAVIDWIAETMQFPWRFLVFTTLCFLLAGVGWLFETKALVRYRSAVCSVLVLAAVLPMWEIVNLTASYGKVTPPDRPLVLIAEEYIPAGADNTDYNRYIYSSDEEKVVIRDYVLEPSKATVWLTCREEGQYIEAPMFHYPGYQAFRGDGGRLPVETGSNSRVRVALSPSDHEQEITVRFAGEDIFRVGYGVTLAAVCWAAGYLNRKRLRRLGNKIRQKRNPG